MNFVNLWGLLGLLGVPLILILHLFRQRNRHYLISNLDLWGFLEKEIHGRNPRRIPLNWILILDLLIMATVTLAWTQPQINFNYPIKEAKHIIVILDSSMSMNALDIYPDRFSQAKYKINSLLSNLGPQDIISLIIFSSKASLVGDSRINGMPDLIKKISELETTGNGHALIDALTLGETLLDSNLPVEFYIFTDKAFTNPGIKEFAYPCHLELIGKESSNQAILNISIKPESLETHNKFQVFTKIGNFSSDNSTRILTLLLDDVPVDSTTISIEPNKFVTQIWESVVGNPSSVSVQLIGNDDLPHDDFRGQGWYRPLKTKVLLVTDDSEALRRGFLSLTNVELEIIKTENYEQIIRADLTVFDNFLPPSLPDSNILIVNPPKNNNIFPIQEIKSIDSAIQTSNPDPILKWVDFNGIRWGDTNILSELPEDYEVLLETDDYPLILKSYRGLNQIIILLPNLDEGNLLQHPIFPIFLGNLIESINVQPTILQEEIGIPVLLPQSVDYQMMTIINPNENEKSYHTNWPNYYDQTIIPGIYTIKMENFNSEVIEYKFGINVGDLVESNLAPQNWDLNNTPQNEISQSVSNYFDLTPWLLLLAVLLLLVEAFFTWQ